MAYEFFIEHRPSWHLIFSVLWHRLNFTSVKQHILAFDLVLVVDQRISWLVVFCDSGDLVLHIKTLDLESFLYPLFAICHYCKSDVISWLHINVLGGPSKNLCHSVLGSILQCLFDHLSSPKNTSFGVCW